MFNRFIRSAPRLQRAVLAAALSSTLGAPLAAGPDLGAYLAGNQAEMQNDFARGAAYFTKGLLSDPANPDLLENALKAYAALGQFDRAAPLAQALVDGGTPSQIAHMVLQVQAVQAGDWQYIFDALQAGHGVAPLVDGLSRAWAHLGLGEIDAALAAFDAVASSEGMTIYGLTHKAYALASFGDFEAADAVFRQASDSGALRYSAPSAAAHAQILSQLGQNPQAIALIDGLFTRSLPPSVADLRARLESGEAVPFTAIANPTEGIADVYEVVASAIINDAPDDFTLLFMRAATALVPDDAAALLTTAQLLQNLGQNSLANDAFAAVPRDSLLFTKAELGRADVLVDAGREDAALEVLDALARSQPDLAEVHAMRGDALRREERFVDAVGAYTRALELFAPDDSAAWFVYYTRGICHHKLDDWPATEADFRAALALRPNQPQVLNYLGYSLVERGEKLDEALGMIEKAADARPDSGAIIDSLAWALFKLGRYTEAVEPMEYAVSLEPADPIINDHLGDVYWAVGRKTEAVFQWKRALSFDPTPEDAAAIRDKLENGLDLTQQAAAADSVKVARDDR